MTAFIPIFILLSAMCVFSGLSAETEISVSKPVGATAILPCDLTNVETDTVYIKWQIKIKTQSNTVFEREGEVSYQDEGYEGRVDVPEEELRKGDCSLVLRNLTLTDTGVYTCSLRVRRTKRDLPDTKVISSVILTVSDRTEETKPPGKAVGRSGDKSGSSGNRGRNLQYLWLLVLPGLVLAALAV